MPLFELTKKRWTEDRFRLNGEAQRAFQKVKELLWSIPP